VTGEPFSPKSTVCEVLPWTEPPVSALYVNVKVAGATGVDTALDEQVDVAHPGPLHEAVLATVALP
jgi:hypothetical protein